MDKKVKNLSDNELFFSAFLPHVVFHAAHDDGLAFEIGQDAAEIFVQFVPQRFVAEERPPVFGGKDRVHQNFGEGLRHVGMMRNSA